MLHPKCSKFQETGGWEVDSGRRGMWSEVGGFEYSIVLSIPIDSEELIMKSVDREIFCANPLDPYWGPKLRVQVSISPSAVYAWDNISV